jgi:predicted NBD/HSP70 family sugar kinase
VDEAQTGAHRSQLREQNRAAVIDFARRHGAFSRAELAEATGLSPATVTRLVRTLIAEGYLADAGEVRLSGGRPQIMLEFRHDAELVAVVDLHDGATEASLLDWAGATYGTSRRPAIHDVRADVRAVLDDLRAEVGSRLKAVAVAIPGVAADGGGDDIRLAPSIGRPAGPLRSVLEAELGLPVVVDNDVNLMVVGEHVGGAAVDTDDVLLMHIGTTGIGAALMIDGAVRHGARGFAGEVGFLPFGAPRPRADELGAFEAEWALGPLAERARRAGAVPEVTAQDLRGDRNRDLWQEALRAWGRAVAATVCVIDPEVVLLSGPDLVPDDLAAVVAEARRYIPGETDIRLASIGPRALLLGGARRAFDAHDVRRFQ